MEGMLVTQAVLPGKAVKGKETPWEDLLLAVVIW